MKRLKAILAGVLALALVVPVMPTKAVLAGEKKSKFKISFNDKVDGRGIPSGEVEVQYSAKDDAAKENRDWFTFNTLKLNGKSQKISVEKDPDKYDYRVLIDKLPWGYVTAEKIKAISTGEVNIDIDRDYDGVKTAVANAKLNFVFHSYPAGSGRVWDIYELAKPSNPDNNPYPDFSYDFGSVFAPWREHEDRVLLDEQTLAKFYKTEYSSYQSILPCLPNKSVTDTVVSFMEDKDSRENSEGEAKIKGLDFNKWYVVRTTENKNIAEYNKLLHNNKTPSNGGRWNSSTDCDTPQGEPCRYYYTNYVISNNASDFTSKSPNMYVRGPRYVNSSRTSFTYDIFYIQPDSNKKIDDVVADDFKQSYDHLINGSDLSADQEDEINAAIDEINKNPEGRTELEETKKKLEEALQKIEAMKEKEKLEEAVAKATELVDKAIETGDPEDIRRAKDAVDALPEGDAKTNLMKKLSDFTNSEVVAKDFKEKNKNIIDGEPSADDAAKIKAALEELSKLSQAAQDKLKTEKKKLEEALAKAEKLAEEKRKEQEATDQANEFKTKNKNIIDGEPSADDTAKIRAALEELSKLSQAAQDKLKTEKKKLEEALAKAEKLAEEKRKQQSAEEQAKDFKEKNKALIDGEPSADDVAKIKAALEELSKLSQAAQDKLKTEKKKLEEALAKAEKLAEEKRKQQSAEEQAKDFKEKNKTLIEGEPSADDAAKIKAALEELSKLSQAAQDKLKGEKKKLEEALAKAEKLAEEKKDPEKIWTTTIIYVDKDGKEIARQKTVTKGTEKVIPKLPEGYVTKKVVDIIPGQTVKIEVLKESEKLAKEKEEKNQKSTSSLSDWIKNLSKDFSSKKKVDKTKDKDDVPETGASQSK